LGFVFIALFFTIGQPFGTLNDLFGGLLLALSLIPIALALHRLLSPRQPVLSLLALGIGLAAMAVFAISAASVILHTFGIVRFVEPRPGTGPFGLGLYAPAFIGVWLILASASALTSRSLPPVLSWIGFVAGVGYAVGVIGFALGGPQSPVVITAGLLTAIGYPIWAIWLGRLLLRGLLTHGI
jgi:hypothetical protein